MRILPPLNQKQRIVLGIFVPLIIIIIGCLLSEFPHKQTRYGQWDLFWATLLIVFFIIIFYEFLLFNNEANDYLRKADILVKKGQYRHAITYFTKAIKLDQHNAHAFLKRAIAYKKINQKDLSFSDLNKALELNNQLDEAYFNNSKSTG